MLRTTQKLVIANADPHGHSVKAELFNNSPFNQLLMAGENLSLSFHKPESSPIKVEDSIKTWMSGYVLIRDEPYATVSDKRGEVTIASLPIGQWTFVVWHESGYIKEATLAGKKVEWPRGRITLDIKAGDNDLGQIKVPVGIFK